MKIEFALAFAVTSNMKRSVSFYRALLGIEPTKESPFWSEFEVGGVRLALHPGQGGAVGGWTVCLATDHLVQFRKMVQDLGSPSLSEYHQTPSGALFEFQDPDGNPVQAIQYGTKVEELTSG